MWGVQAGFDRSFKAAKEDRKVRRTPILSLPASLIAADVSQIEQRRLLAFALQQRLRVSLQVVRKRAQGAGGAGGLGEQALQLDAGR